MVRQTTHCSGPPTPCQSLDPERLIEAALTKHREKETAEEWARGRIGRVGWHDVFVSCITPTIDVSIAISDHHENTKYGRYVFLAKGRILRNPTYTCSFHDPMIKREDQPAPGIHAIYIYIFTGILGYIFNTCVYCLGCGSFGQVSHKYNHIYMPSG